MTVEQRIINAQTTVIANFKACGIDLKPANRIKENDDDDYSPFYLTTDRTLCYSEEYVTKIDDKELEACIALTLRQYKYVDKLMEKKNLNACNIAANIVVCHEMKELGMPIPKDSILQLFNNYEGKTFDEIYTHIVGVGESDAELPTGFLTKEI